MPLDVPKFPISYPPTGEDYSTRLVTLTEQLARRTFAWVHPEIRRRFTAVQLKVWEASGGALLLGVGTGWRVQPAGLPNHAEPGNSHHEAMPVSPTPPKTPENGATAIDTVGCKADGAVASDSVWTEMEKHLRDCGLYNFDPGGGDHATNYDGVAYHSSWDRPHVQGYDMPDSRKYRTKPYALEHWPLEPKYDIDVVGLDPFAHPLWGGDNPEPEPTPEPPAPVQEDDDMIMIAQGTPGPGKPGLWAITPSLEKFPIWQEDRDAMIAAGVGKDVSLRPDTVDQFPQVGHAVIDTPQG